MGGSRSDSIIDYYPLKGGTEAGQEGLMYGIDLVSIVRSQIFKKDQQGKGIAAIDHGTVNGRRRTDVKAFYRTDVLQGLQTFTKGLLFSV